MRNKKDAPLYRVLKALTVSGAEITESPVSAGHWSYAQVALESEDPPDMAHYVSLDARTHKRLYSEGLISPHLNGYALSYRITPKGRELVEDIEVSK